MSLAPATSLVRSRFLVRIPIDADDAVWFHSLFGTSLVFSREAEALLDLFRTPTTVGIARAWARGDVLPALGRLVERRFLVDPAVDERRDFVRRMRPEPPETGAHLRCLVLLAAEQCNLACPYCIKDHLMGLRPARRQARMTVATALRAVDAFVEVAGRNAHEAVAIQFRGGESLLNPPVVLEATRRLRARWARGPVAASMVTNATLVTEAIAAALADLDVSVEVSLDGPRAVHDLVRPTRGGRPTYDAVLAGLARLRAAGVAVTNVNTTITAATRPLVDGAFLAALAALGIRGVNVEPDVLSPVDPDPEALAGWLLGLREEGRRLGIDVGGCWGRALRSIGAVGSGQPLPLSEDYPLLVVDARGQVVRWEYNGEEELGPVADLPGVLASAAFGRHVQSRTPGTIPECLGCEVEGLCQGNASTTLVYERATGRPGLFQHRCALIRAMTRGVLREEAARPAGAETPFAGPAVIKDAHDEGGAWAHGLATASAIASGPTTASSRSASGAAPG